MKIILLFILMLIALNLNSQQVHFKNEPLLKNNNFGKLFVVAFPPNEANDEFPKLKLSIKINTITETHLVLSNNKGLFKEYTFNKGSHEISTDKDLSWDLENRIEGEISQNGIVIESDNPISVTVLNSKNTSSEAYTAIPVEKLGNEYIVSSFWDFNEARKWKSGFMVLAYHDNTRIEMFLKGRGEQFKTASGNSLGDNIVKTLDKGEIYMIHGTGESRGEFDLTGSILKGNKDFAVIAFSERVMIPAYVVTNGRDHLSEMIFPVKSAGKEFVSIEFDRGTDKGDYFRVIATEDDTEFSVSWYDKQTHELIDTWDGILENKGDFDEYSKVSAQVPHNNESIRGIAFFTANKPIQVYQYAYSINWDQSSKSNFDPLMISLPSLNNLTKASKYSSVNFGSGQDITLNSMNLVLYSEDKDIDSVDLTKIFINDKNLVEIYPEINNKIFKGQNRFDQKILALNLDIETEIIEIISEIPFYSTNVVGTTFNAYGTVTSFGINDKNKIDTLKPQVEVAENCGSFEMKITDNVKLNNSEINQVDIGFNEIPYIVESNNIINFDFDYDKELDKKPNETWFGYPYEEELNFKFEVEDKKKDAFVRFHITDATYENVIDTTFYYYAEKLTQENHDFGLLRMGDSKTFSLEVENLSSSSISTNSISLKNGENGFSFLGPDNYIFNQNESQTFSIIYSPKHEYFDSENSQYDSDTLEISFDCVSYNYIFKGKGGENYLAFSDWEMEELESSKSYNTNSGSNVNFYVQNYNFEKDRPSTYPLEVYGIDIENITDESGEKIELSPYFLSHDIKTDLEGNFSKSFTIFPGQEDNKIELNYLNFYSEESGTFIRNLPLRTNAKNINYPGGKEVDSISTVSKFVLPQLSLRDIEDKIKIYPNPAKNYIELKSQVGFISEYKIMDLEGKLIKEGKYQNKIYVGDLSIGTYLVRCKIYNKHYDKKLIIE